MWKISHRSTLCEILNVVKFRQNFLKTSMTIAMENRKTWKNLYSSGSTHLEVFSPWNELIAWISITWIVIMSLRLSRWKLTNSTCWSNIETSLTKVRWLLLSYYNPNSGHTFYEWRIKTKKKKTTYIWCLKIAYPIKYFWLLAIEAKYRHSRTGALWQKHFNFQALF